MDSNWPIFSTFFAFPDNHGHNILRQLPISEVIATSRLEAICHNNNIEFKSLDLSLDLAIGRLKT